jgi:DNA-binding transcriptional LysR family regulator
MEIRVLRYFLAVAREETISAAAEALHVTQPTLSRQLMELEEELGKKLFIRGNRKIALTEEGMILRKRAEEVMELLDKTRVEVSASAQEVGGEIHIGGAETEGVRFVAEMIKELQAEYPRIVFHISSGNAQDVGDRIDRGLIDFGLLVDPADMSKYDYIKLPGKDVWGVLMRKESPLADKKTIRPKDLFGVPLIISAQSMVKNEISGWMGGKYNKLNIVATYNLLFNASLLVEEDVGYALCLDKIIKISKNSSLCFRPLEPKLEVGLSIVWKKNQVFSKPSRIFIERVQERLR